MNPPRPTLGVVAISQNEEKDLPGFFRHLLPWVDEIVIVDDGSSDRTAELAQSAGSKIKFISSPRQPGEDYSHQRNKGILAATSDWLLHMDIDERVTPELAEEILSNIQNSAKDGYRFRRLNFFLHRPMRGGGWQQWNLIHLARRTQFQFGGKMHETCLLDAPAERVGQLKAMMWHLNDDGYLERMRKSCTYSQVDAEDLLQRGKSARWFHLLLHPLKMFIVKFILQKGYRDGVLGLLSAIHSADATMRTYALVWDAQNHLSREALENQLLDRWKTSQTAMNSSPAKSRARLAVRPATPSAS